MGPETISTSPTQFTKFIFHIYHAKWNKNEQQLQKEHNEQWNRFQVFPSPK